MMIMGGANRIANAPVLIHPVEDGRPVEPGAALGKRRRLGLQPLEEQHAVLFYGRLVNRRRTARAPTAGCQHPTDAHAGDPAAGQSTDAAATGQQIRKVQPEEAGPYPLILDT
jgi:hypothetical protein